MDGRLSPEGLALIGQENMMLKTDGTVVVVAPWLFGIMDACTDGRLMKQSAIKYVGQLYGVRELALLGTADLSWWRDHLAGEELEPIEVDQSARVLVTGLESKWMGMPFRDLSVSVSARCLYGSKEEGYLLAGAFNASRFITFFERRWFKSPYQFRADLHVELGNQSTIRLGNEPAQDLIAEMGPRESEENPVPAEEMGYTGPLFIPKGRDRTINRWFMVKIHGLTSTIDYDAKRDRFEISSECTDPILSGLRASQFRGIEWFVRQNATHKRSKTFQIRTGQV